VRTLTIAGWEAFRGAARRLLAEGVAPADVALVDAAAGNDALP
jgi:hypothetical protein